MRLPKPRRLETAARNETGGESEELLEQVERGVAGILPEVEAHLAEAKV
jgi:hypothetical protein